MIALWFEKGQKRKFPPKKPDNVTRHMNSASYFLDGRFNCCMSGHDQREAMHAHLSHDKSLQLAAVLFCRRYACCTWQAACLIVWNAEEDYMSLWFDINCRQLSQRSITSSSTMKWLEETQCKDNLSILFVIVSFTYWFIFDFQSSWRVGLAMWRCSSGVTT